MMNLLRRRHVAKSLLFSARPFSSDLLRTVNDAIIDLESTFAKAEVPEPRVSALHLIGHVTDCKNVEKVESAAFKATALTDQQSSQLKTFKECRLARMPVQYIVGEWTFRDLELKMRPPVFIPRPETEELVGHVLDSLGVGEDVLEIGCGTGAISLSLLREAASDQIKTLKAVDQSPNACTLAMENAVELGLQHKLEILNSKLEEDGRLEGIPEDATFSTIVSNPPYILRKDLMELPPEIMVFEDLRALNGGDKGLDVIISILQFASRQLTPSGRLFLEVDPCHHLLLPKEIEKYSDVKVKVVKVLKDFGGKDRFLVLERT